MVDVGGMWAYMKPHALLVGVQLWSAGRPCRGELIYPVTQDSILRSVPSELLT